MTHSNSQWSLQDSHPNFIGKGLQGPECVLTEANGSLWCTHPRGLSHIARDGQVSHMALDFNNVNAPAEPTEVNGFCRLANGSFLLADMGGRRVIETDSDGIVTRVISEGNQGPLGQVNYVHRDHQQRIWVVVQSHRRSPDDALDPKCCDGELYLMTGNGLERVLNGLYHPNQLAVSTDGTTLYLPQTNARNILRLNLDRHGRPGQPEIFGPRDHGMLIDGVALDEEGRLWGTHVGADRIFTLSDTEGLQIRYADPAAESGGQALYSAFLERQLTSDHIASTGAVTAPLMTSLAFGSANLKTLYVGNLGSDRLAAFPSPVPGQVPAHWLD